MPKKQEFARRTFLSSAIGSGIIAKSAISRIKTQSQRAQEVSISGSNEETILLSDRNSISRAEFNEYLSELTGKYDEQKTSNARPNTSNLSFVKAWNSDFVVRSEQTGWKLAETDHALALFVGDKRDDTDRKLYYFWQWSISEAVDSPLYTAKTRIMRNHVNLADESDLVTGFNPENVIQIEGETIEVSIGASYGGVYMGVSKELEIEGGEIGPEAGKVDLGGAGQYSVKFDGCLPNTTITNGAIEARSEENLYESDQEISWNISVSASTVGC